MKKVLCYLKDYKKECILAPLFKMTEAVFELFVPLVIAEMIDRGIGQADKTAVIKDFILLLVLGAVGLTVSIIAQYFSAKAATGFAARLRHHLFEHMMGLSFTEIDHIGTSTMIARMTNDVNQAQNGVNMFLRLFLRSPFVVFGAMIMAFTIDFKCAMIFVLAILGLGIIVFLITVVNIKMLTVVQGRLDRVLKKTRENLEGVRVIRAFCREQKEEKEFYRENHLLTKKQKLAGCVSGLMNPMTYILINIAIVLLIHTGSIRVSLGVLSQGAVVALYNYMSQILVELIKLANLIVTLSRAMASIRRIEEVFDIENTMENGTVKEGNFDEIVFDHVGLTYSGNSEESLTDISFSMKKGQTVGIIGGTGSGKTSLVHLLPRFYDVTAGQILLDGKNLKDYDIAFLRDHISVVMQTAAMFRGTVEENLCLRGKQVSGEELQQAVSISQSKDVVEKKGGLDGKIEQHGRNLSGGQKQRLSIARALTGNPDVLILDDSSSALDFATDAALRRELQKIKQDKMIFIVSQRTSSIQQADLILVLEDGRLVGKGTHEELLNQCEVYREIYESQYSGLKKEGQQS